MSHKEAVLDTVRSLPDEVSFEEIIEEIAIVAGIRRAEAAADAGEVISHDELRQRVASWISR